MIRDASGNLYGTTPQGGPANAGTVYKLNTTGQETVLCDFASPPDGSNPSPNLIRDEAGNLYGITSSGRTNNGGVVYKLYPSGNETVLYTFTGQGDNGFPDSLIRDPAGNLYGTTYWGIVFELQPSGQFTLLHTFTSGADGFYPGGPLALDSQGNLYGTTQQGGGSANAGTIYKVDPAGNETILYAFSGGADGGLPVGGVTRDSAGNLYGTTYNGGTGNGVVFMLDASGTETVLHTFTGKTDGGRPYAAPVRDANGNLYGTASTGGKGNGVVFKLDPTGKETVLHAFAGAADGTGPTSGLIQDSARGTCTGHFRRRRRKCGRRLSGHASRPGNGAVHFSGRKRRGKPFGQSGSGYCGESVWRSVQRWDLLRRRGIQARTVTAERDSGQAIVSPMACLSCQFCKPIRGTDVRFVRLSWYSEHTRFPGKKAPQVPAENSLAE